MIRVEETITGRCPPGEAFGFLAEFANVRAWDPTVLAARKLTPGPPQVGSRFELRLQMGARPVPMAYTLTEMHAPQRLVFQGQGQTFRARDEIVIEPAGSGFRLRYEVRIDVDHTSGRRRRYLIEPLVRLNARRAVKRLQTILGGNDSRLPRLGPGTLIADRLIVPGLIAFTRLGYRMRHRRWPLPPQALTGRRVVLTGGTSGIGLAAAGQLLDSGARLVLVGRDPVKTEDVCRRLRNRVPGGDVDFEIADLGHLQEVSALGRRLRERYAEIHVLVNNAGALFDRREKTAEGFERTLATDLLSPCLLTRLLLPTLTKAPGGRVVNVSSGGMYTQKIRPDDLSYLHGAFDGAVAYARAKRGLVILSDVWAAELSGRQVSIQAMHPGWVDTPGLQSSLPAFYHRMRPWLRSPDQGADTITWLAASPVAGQTSGLFWLDRRPRAKHFRRATRETRAERERFLAEVDRMLRPFS